MRIRPRGHRGAVLVLVLVMLGLLAMLAISLATSSALDKNVSYNYMDEVRARLVAKAGVEAAIARIQSMIQRGEFEDPAMTYWGSKTTEEGKPDVDTPLTLAANPSYAFEDEATQNPDDGQKTPVIFTLDDRKIGISGMMTNSAYGVHSDVYRLRVSDCNSRINVNDGLTDSDVTKNLTRILDNLGDACGVESAGVKIISKRPLHGFRARRELKEALGEENYKKLGHHITPFAWTDKDLVTPVPLSQATLGAYPVDYNSSISLYRYGRSRFANGNPIPGFLEFAPDYANPKGVGHAVYGLDELNAQWIRLTKRSPVNVNGASVEVLTALISDLRGIFMTDRRKKNPGGGQYTFMAYPKCPNGPTSNPESEPLGSEIGFLYATPPFQGPAGDTKTGTSSGAISAKVVAEEIIACRTLKPSKTGFDYSSAWFGGPFRTWLQFNAFCDNLITIGVLGDNRGIFYDYAPGDRTGGGGWSWSPDWGIDNLIASACQPKVAAQALADVLKANFNPNCTLNELNPDRNLYLEVDKTDLISHSTEFCFTPAGFFEIECEGLIVKTPRGDDLVRSRIGVIQSRELIECVVKAFDIYKDSSQSDFYKGDMGLTVRRQMTNSNKPIELGPEPEAGELPEDCRWSGWLQLSTLGGIRRSDVKNAVMSTPKAKSELGASAFAHYQFDHRLNHHAGDLPHPLQFSGDWGNKPDRTEQHAGPYNPTRGGRGEFRLARDYVAGDEGLPDYKAVSDLRIDGVYIERDNAMLYPCTIEVFATIGTVGFWLKPSFRPEMTGKPRTFFSTDTYAGWQLINSLWFFPAHDAPAYQASSAENGPPAYANGPWRPISICGGYATPGGWGGGVGHATNSLNHSTHADAGDGSQDLMKHHEWMYVAYKWDMAETTVRVMVNDMFYPSSNATPEVHVHPNPTTAAAWTSVNALFRLGEPSTTMEYPGGSRNWSVDATLDEFYMWKGNSLSSAQQLYDKGRYHVPRAGQEGLFTSASLSIATSSIQKLADPTTVRPPVRPREGGGRTTMAGPLDTGLSSELMRPLCAFWTEYPAMMHMLGKKDYKDLKETRVGIEITLQMMLDGIEAGEVLKDGGGSSIVGVSMKKGQHLAYRLKFSMPEHLGKVLTATPVVDDVTIYYTKGVEYIHYNRLDLE